MCRGVSLLLLRQERTRLYIARQGEALVEMLFSLGAVADIVDLSLLKCRQRDQLEEIFKYWSCDTPCDGELHDETTVECTDAGVPPLPGTAQGSELCRM